MAALKGPSYSEIKQFIINKDLVEFETINNKIIRGNILWFDNNSFHIAIENDKKLTLLGSSIVSYSKV